MFTITTTAIKFGTIIFSVKNKYLTENSSSADQQTSAKPFTVVIELNDAIEYFPIAITKQVNGEQLLI